MTIPNHFLDLKDMDAQVVRHILDLAHKIKANRSAPEIKNLCHDKTLAMIFDRPSTRTRVSFDVGMRQLGGQTLNLTGQEMQLGRGESLSDTAQVLSRYVDIIMIRILDHSALMTFAKHASIPVINGLTRHSHPCQIMADLLTFEEHRGPIKGKTVTWVGDANNVFLSWAHAAQKFEFTLRFAGPEELSVAEDVIAWARNTGTKLTITTDVMEAADKADLIITDTWVSMGDTQAEQRHALLKPFQVTPKVMDAAKSECLFMHCLPAHRGEEMTADVIDGPQSVVFDEAENRLHAQKAILAWCLKLDTMLGL